MKKVSFEICVDDGAVGTVLVFFMFVPYILIFSSYGRCILWCRVPPRRGRELILASGIGLNGLLNQVLKWMFRLPRPEPSCEMGYGMPSGHAQFMAFYVTFLFFRDSYAQEMPTGREVVIDFVDFWKRLWGTLRRTMSRVNVGREPYLPHLGLFERSMWFILWVIVAWSRVQNGYHTIWQVFFGSLCGIVIAWMYFSVTWRIKETERWKRFTGADGRVRIVSSADLSDYYGTSPREVEDASETV
jgi:membrane-associated phospholipid phosphatase